MPDDDLVVTPSLRIPRSEISERFTTSGGPGGQHANKVATRVELAFDVTASAALNDRQRARILDRCGPIVRVVVDETRSQARNRELATQRLAERLVAALTVERTRLATRPSRSARRRRLDAKKRRSDLKSSRRRPHLDT